MSDQWRELPTSDAIQFLDAVRDSDHGILFEPSVCKVFLHPLDFFDGYDLIRVSNQYSPPFMLLDYVSNGCNHYYLDGSDHAFQTLCSQKSVRLTAENVLQYIDIYFSYVYERGNTVVYIRHFEDYEPSLQQNEDGYFIIHTRLIYQDEMRDAIVHVHPSGQIDIVSPANVSFLDAPQGHEDIAYIHPQEDNILEQTNALMSASETAQEYLKNISEHKIDIRVFSSPNYQATTFNKPIIYLFMPAAQLTADYHQVLLLGGALHDAQQIMGGYKRPSIDEDDVLFFNINHDKNLKLIAGICKIVEEFEALEMPEAVQAIENLGLRSVYEGFKANISADDLMERYIQALRDRGLIIEG